ncbi:hypothetical protein COO60DRAFT_1211694 [Scenedesmus sp. NREL 46B-D3]|nr:hypothetical protein COO60DRAFT_1211694 [Scenedesmus sp. NREL 46B-D3]
MGPMHPSTVPQQPQQLQQLLQDLTSATAACVPDYGARQLANSLWALNRLGLGPRVSRKVKASYLAAFAAKLPGAAPQHISNAAMAVGGMGWGTSSQWRQSLLQAAASKQQFFKPQELANLLYALPLLEAQPSQQWLSGFLNACYDSLPSFNSQELSLLGLGLVRLHHKPQREWLAAYLQAVQVHLQATGMSPGFTSSSSSSSIGVPDAAVSVGSAEGGSSSSSSSSDSLFGAEGSSSTYKAQPAAATAAAPGSRPAGFQAQGFVNVLRVLCAWGERPGPAWRSSCLAAAGRLLPQLGAEGSSTLVWAMAKLQMPPSRALLARLLVHSQPQLRAASATDLALLAWGLGTLGITPCSSSSSSSSSSATAANSSSSSVSRLLLPWLSEFMYYSHRALGSATARDVACLLVGAVRMRLQPDGRWLQRVAVEAHHRLPRMRPTELTNTLLCLARLKATPDAAFMATFCSCSSRLLNRTASVAGSVTAGKGLGAAAAAGRQLLQAHSSSTSSTPGSTLSSTSSSSTAAAAADLYCPQTLTNTLGAMAMLRYQPPRAWSRAFLAASQQLLPAFTPRDFSFAIWALAQLEVQPQPHWLDLFLVQLRQHVPTMDSAQLSATIWALAKLGHQPGVDWMQRFLDRVVALTDSTPQQHCLLTSVQSFCMASLCGLWHGWTTRALAAAVGAATAAATVVVAVYQMESWSLQEVLQAAARPQVQQSTAAALLTPATAVLAAAAAAVCALVQQLCMTLTVWMLRMQSSAVWVCGRVWLQAQSGMAALYFISNLENLKLGRQHRRGRHAYKGVLLHSLLAPLFMLRR